MSTQGRFCISIDDIRDAADRIDASTIRTPVITAPAIDERTNANLFFKCENQQFVGAFKARGATNAVLSLTDQQAAAGVVTHSSGNHAAALARAARIRGVTAHIVMPHNSARIKLDAVRKFGIEPVLCEPDSDSRQAAADQIAEQTGATFIHPFNNANIIAGQGTAALELLEQVPELDMIVAPVGGGGLLSGTLIAVAGINPEIAVIAAEPEWADDAYRSLQSGRIERPLRYDTVADGLRTPLGNLTYPIIRDLVTEILLADEDAIRSATVCMLRDAKTLAEPSGAVPLAAILTHVSRFRGRRVGVIVSGGNIDSNLLIDLLQE